jgi:cell division protein ZapA (FtsZ GTPase activity inhibitor)
MPPSGERKTVRVNILNQQYSLTTSGDPSDVEEAARKVDDLMRDYSRAANLDTTRAAVLACLDLASQIQALQREVAGIKERVDVKTRELNILLDQVID